MDIVRLERRNLQCGIEKYIAIAQYFNITVNELINNQLVSIIKSQLDRPFQSAAARKQKIIQEARKKTGDTGEETALVYEIQRHLDAGKEDVSFIDPTPADKPKNGFDIASMTMDGKALMIEVKASRRGLDTDFFITRTELNKAEWAMKNGLEYLVYRVVFAGDEDHVKIYVFTIDELRKLCVWEPEIYRLKFKDENYDRT